MGDLIQRDIVDTKAPDKIVNVLDMLLVELGGEESFKRPLIIMDWANLSHLLKGSDTRLHDWYFPLAIVNLLSGYGGSTSSVDNALIVSDGDKSTMLIKHTPVFFDQLCVTRTLIRLQVGQIEFLLKALAMVSLRTHIVKNWAVLVKDRGVKLLLPENNTALNIAKEVVIGVQFVREAAVILKNITGLLLGTKGRFGRHLDEDRQSCGYRGQSRCNARPIHIQRMMQ